MKLLLVSTAFAPSVGGVERFASMLAHGLARRGAAVTVATATRAGPGGDDGLPFRVVRRPGLRSLWQMIGEHDVVELAGPVFLPLLLSWLRRKPVVITHHGYQAICPNGLLLFEPTKSACAGHFMAGRPDRCAACNAATVGWARSLRMLVATVPRRLLSRRVAANVSITGHVGRRLALPHARTIYYGIPAADTAAGSGEATPARTPCFAYVGRLVSEKGLPLLVDAAARLAGGSREFRVKLVGDGPERARLQAQIEELGLQGVVNITGFLSGEALDAALRDVTAVVMPSIWEETAGLAAIEHMMRGRVVVVADVGGLAEVVGTAGLKFPVGDVEALVGCLRKVLDAPALAARLGAAGRRRSLELFQEDRMVADYLALFRSLAAGRDRGALAVPVTR